ncbi:hypothetical protein SD70_00045 [Gordoniibacillus kamchatkensis]|uniref:L,D-TPase catalytic domain-containing protein n=1 Tax=Gordoniibacillus kamchatkensis TaxID=1590651 RepID=A0ABR5ANH9_9BACL|nr:hypothetical protein SD70_00045 [Paenibacillus sp. VKM B-2647]
MSYLLYNTSLHRGYRGAEEDISRVKKIKESWLKTRHAAAETPRLFTKNKLIVLLSVLVLGLLLLLLLLLLSNFEDRSAPVAAAGSDRSPQANLKTPPPASSYNVDPDFLPVNMLRNAVFRYYAREGKFPSTLEDLTKPFPSNVLSAVPVEFYSNETKVRSAYDGSGGWVYSPPPPASMPVSEQNAADIAEQSLYPNHPRGCAATCKFEPFAILIDKQTHLLKLVSGDFLLFQYPVALGKNNSTPAGDFLIAKKVANPNSHVTDKSVFGARGMELSNPKYAIHGTIDDRSIGTNITAGCIRMHNDDIEQLFDAVSLSTPVHVLPSIPEDRNLRPIHSPNVYRSDKSFYLPKETDRHTVYNWAF